MKTTTQLVKEFQNKFESPVLKVGEKIPLDRAVLRLKLIVEELDELFEAAAGTPKGTVSKAVLSATELDLLTGADMDIVSTAEELGDLAYVVSGFAIEAGIPLDKVVEEIHESNMSKLGEGGKPIYREDGKVLKGPGFFKANVEKVLFVNKGEEPA